MLADDFEALFVTEAGVELRVPWRRLPDSVDDLGRPVRSFPSYRGQRGFPGWYWASTLGRLVGFESWVERDHLVALDFDARWPGSCRSRFGCAGRGRAAGGAVMLRIFWCVEPTVR